jgi:hypothetical protein
VKKPALTVLAKVVLGSSFPTYEIASSQDTYYSQRSGRNKQAIALSGSSYLRACPSRLILRPDSLSWLELAF